MPATFLEAKTELLQYAKRTPSDAQWSALAGGIINESVKKLQRLIPDMNAIKKIEPGFVYPAGSAKVSFVDAVENTDINKIVAVHVTSSGSDLFGEPIRLYTPEQLTTEMSSFQEGLVRSELDFQSSSFQDYVVSVFGRVGYVINTDLAIYPTPTQQITLSLFYTPWMADMVADSDTNVLLKYCWDFILYSSLVKLNVVLSEGDRVNVSSGLLSYALSEARSWDASLSYSHPVNM